MQKLVLAVVLIVFVSAGLVEAAPNKLFDVTLEDVQGGGRVLAVSFYRRLPRPEIVDKIVRDSLDHAILIDPAVDILASGFFGDEVLNANQYSGALVYKASQRTVMTFDQYRGVTATTSSTKAYFVEVKEDQTLEGIEPERKWLMVAIVFQKKPNRDAAYEAILAETRKLAARSLDIQLYVSVGDKGVKTSWKQMRDSNGAYIFAEYNAATKKLTRQGQLLRQQP